MKPRAFALVAFAVGTATADATVATLLPFAQCPDCRGISARTPGWIANCPRCDDSGKTSALNRWLKRGLPPDLVVMFSTPVRKGEYRRGDKPPFWTALAHLAEGKESARLLHSVAFAICEMSFVDAQPEGLYVARLADPIGFGPQGARVVLISRGGDLLDVFDLEWWSRNRGFDLKVLLRPDELGAVLLLQREDGSSEKPKAVEMTRWSTFRRIDPANPVRFGLRDGRLEVLGP